ncbi:hypothetical protein [Pseudoalteromonas ostreae]|uniref:hypothetical protein n=1 Tax=Pseudoalteromonas ostreae TaxID=2774154 RepID=UPI0023AA4824|nr:hypothetical protein [Pseudoalteromonas ostreae]
MSGKGRYNQQAILRARLNLHMAGIGINDPHNGIWLINFVKNKAHDWLQRMHHHTGKYIDTIMNHG